MRSVRRNFPVCVAALCFFLLNKLWLIPHCSGLLGWFLSCYANDIAAGCAICAWTDLLLSLAQLPRLRTWKQTVPFLLLCGLVWEYLTPIWKASAVCDPLDLIAYQAGGLLWLYYIRRFNKT